MQNVIVHDDFAKDPLAEVAARLDGPKAPKPIPISDFIKGHGVSYDPQAANLRRSNAKAIETDDARVLDRVVELSPETVELIGQRSSMLHRGQVLDHYREILTLRSGSSPGMRYSTVGYLHPLPTQWQLVRDAGIAVRTPDYLYGYGPTPVDVSELVDPVFKSPFDLYGWSNRTPPEAGELWDQFIVDLPIGLPILTYFLGEQCSMHVLKEGNGPAPEELDRTLFSFMDRISTLFGDPVAGEILWWVDGAEVTFGAFSHFLSGAARTTTFNSEASAFFERYFG